MVLLFFALDLRTLSPPLLTQVKQCLLELANFYAVSSPPLKNRKLDYSIGCKLGLCYLRRSANSSSDEVKIAYSPRGRHFSLHDFHYAVNHLPSDSYTPSLLDDSESFLFRDMDISLIFKDEVLDSFGDKDVERKVILISSCLVGNMDSTTIETLMDAANRCVSMEFVFFEQKSSQLSDISENITNFRRQICDLENCSFNAYLPADSQVVSGLVKRWSRELKDDTEKVLQAHFVFQSSFNGSINQISCVLCNSINQIMDRFIPSTACTCDGIPWDGTGGCDRKEYLSCNVTKSDPSPDDTNTNSVKVAEHTLSIEASWRSWTNLCQVYSAVVFNVIERTSLASLSEGVIVGRPFIVIPSVGQETDTTSEESDKCQLNNQLFHGLCRALYSLNQGLVCWSFCNMENMRETAFYHYYVLQPSDNGPLLLRRLAGAEEILPFPDVNLNNPSSSEEVDCFIQQCLQEVELRDYNPVQHSGGIHQKMNELMARGLQSGLVTLEAKTASDLTCCDIITLQSSLSKDNAAPQGETNSSHNSDDHNKGIVRLTQEWEQLIVGDIPRLISLPAEPNSEKSTTSPPANQKPLDARTSKILERLGNPKLMKTKVGSPTEVSGIVRNASDITTGNVTDQSLITTSHLIKPTFQRLKRKYR